MSRFREIPVCISAANRIIERTNAQNAWRYELGKPQVRLSVKRIQKILYLCQLFWFMDHDKSNMIPEDFVAWPNGPVIPEIYDYWLVTDYGYMRPYPYVTYKLSEEEADVINIIVDNTIDIPTETIIDYTHTPFGPWEQVYKDDSRTYAVIPQNIIKQYIRKEDAQRELIDFIKNETARYEKEYETSKLSKKLYPEKYIG